MLKTLALVLCVLLPSMKAVSRPAIKRSHVHRSALLERLLVDTSACLNAHNDKRALHDGVDNLAWDATLASESATFAQSLAQNNQFQHSDANGAYGENLYYWAGASSDPSAPGVVKTCADAVAAWYGEISLYNFDNPGFNQATGHFTQVVWKATTAVGVGIATIQTVEGGWTWTKTYVVARYTPAGNVMEQFATNVPNLISASA